MPQGIANPQVWAMSPAGINYAMNHIASVAKGLHGQAAVDAIVRQFERPANPEREIAGAWARYGQYAGGAPALPPGAPPALPPGRPSSRGAVLRALSGARPVKQPNYLGDMLSVLKMVGYDTSAFSGFQGMMPPAPVQGSLGPSTAPASPLPGRVIAPGMKVNPKMLAGIKRAVKLQVPVVDETSVGGMHQTMGLPGFPAHDYFAPAGTPVVAPITGKVIKLSGYDPKMGPIEGPHGPLGWSVYIQAPNGSVYYLTHMGSRNVKLGETLKAGQIIGTVADYAQYGTPSHIHMGIHTG